MKHLLLFTLIALSGCAVKIPTYTLSGSALQLGPVQLGSGSVTVQSHTDVIGHPSTSPSPAP